MRPRETQGSGDDEAVRSAATALTGLQAAAIVPASLGDPRAADAMRRLGASSLLAAPLAMPDGGIRGVIAIWDRRPGRSWRTADTEMIHAVAEAQSALLVLRESVLVEPHVREDFYARGQGRRGCFRKLHRVVENAVDAVAN